MLNNMNNLRYFFFISLILSSCSSLEKRDKERKLQTQILSKVTQKSPQFSKCAKDNDIFKHFKSDRVRVELIITLNHLGQIESFQTDEKIYPDKFMDCIFNTLDNASFPKLEDGEAVQFTQPFIFRKD